MSEQLCLYCHEPIPLNPRAVRVEGTERIITQKACGKEECQRQRRWAANRLWRKENPEWSENQQGWQRAFGEQHTGCWKGYRAGNAAYRERERQRMRRKRAERVAKVDGIRHDPVGHLEKIREIPREGVAKVDGIAAQLDEVVDYLEVLARVAKVDGIVSGMAGV